MDIPIIGGVHNYKAEFDCIYCGSGWCYGTCRDNGVDEIFYGGEHRNMEILPTLQTAPGSDPGVLRKGQESSGRPTPALPEVPTGLPFTTKAYSRRFFPGRNRFSDQKFNSVHSMAAF